MAKKTAVADAPAPEETEDGGGGGKRKLILILAIVLVLGLLGGAAKVLGFIGGPSEEELSEAGLEPTATPTATELGLLVQLDSVTLNLAAGRFLKLGVAVEMAPGVSEEPPTAPIYDEVIELFAPLTFEELTIAEVREQTKTTLLEGLTQTYGPDIVNVYYTEFVMQ